MSSNLLPHTCRNCCQIGHQYKDCPHPITSFGIICYKKVYYPEPHIEYLLIQRKDSLSFMEFIRGKYDIHQINYICQLMSCMTHSERESLLSKSFEELWSQVWYQPNISRQINEFTIAKSKFEHLQQGVYNNGKIVTMKSLLQISISTYTEPEWGFPKGRRRIKEDDVICAIREFCEETNFKNSDIQLVSDIKPFEELFFGTNNVLYRHIYYVAQINEDSEDTALIIDPQNINQAREVRAVKWFGYEDVIKNIRDHNQERKKLFLEAHRKICKYNGL